MVKLLEATEIDPITEQVEDVMDAAEEAMARKQFAYTPNPGDLSDGGTVNGVRVRPNRDKNITKGRPAARRAWMWNGTESLLPLAWNPEGNRHDGARHYLLKRHCLCCHSGGFFGRQCKNCVKNNCDRCQSSTDTTTVQTLNGGKTVKGWIIPNFYLKKEDVPFQARFYGNVSCAFDFCPRQGSNGFLTEEAMRVHAAKKHPEEYKARMETLAATKTDQVDRLQRLVDELLARPSVIQPMAVQAAPQAASTGKTWTPARRKAASDAAKKRIAAGSAA